MNIFRKIIERLSRGKIVKRRITVGSESCSIYASPDAQLKYLKFGKAAFDNDLIEIALRNINRNDVVWDIGANVGVFSFAAAMRSKTGTVLSVEADTWLVGILRKTALLEEYSGCDICVLPAAISNNVSIESFTIASRGRASNALSSAGGRSQMGGVREIQYVPTLTLDFLMNFFPKPDFVKIDIEGAELMAIESAQKLIKDVRPTFYIEVGEDVSSQIYDIFQAADYSVIDPQTDKVLDHCLANTLFVPKE